MNYLYGTFLALRGLQAAGVSDMKPGFSGRSNGFAPIRIADGGWGESCASYDKTRFTPGPSTASQTAWAILALLAGGDIRSEQPHKGVEYLVRTQRPDGTWEEDYADRHRFPASVFYLAYTDYRNTFPSACARDFGKRIDCPARSL